MSVSHASERPWASGPAELLKHGLDLLRKDSDVHRRLALISIDNSVELMIKVYLGLPRRVTGLAISRKEYQDFSESFPLLLDALEKHASSRLSGVDLGDIEWYHRLRNQLYHQGNGLTVERDKVEVYSELARTLFSNLFGFALAVPTPPDTALLGEFLAAWVTLERALFLVASKRGVAQAHGSPLRVFGLLRKENVITQQQLIDLDAIRDIRNRVIHGQVNHQEVLTPDLIARLKALSSAVTTAAPPEPDIPAAT